MKYINKTIASETAFNMLQSARNKIESKEKELSDFCEKLVINSYNPTTYEMVKNLEEGWVQKRSGFYFSTDYSRGISTHTTNLIKCRYDDSNIRVTSAEFEKIKKHQAEISTMKQQNNTLTTQIVETLLKLRTAEKIKNKFPEAYKCLPKDSMPIGGVISLPIEKILKGINDFPE